MFRLLRVHQYLKNLFILAPLFFSFHYEASLILNVLITFALFSLLASSIYIFNDLLDIEEDRAHPTKKFRPLASGEVTKERAKIMIATLSIGVFSFTYFFNSNLLAIFLIYFILNILYTVKLKHISLIDIFIIAVGFILRILAGAIVIDIAPSMWIVLVTFLLALFLAFAKRRDDVLLSLDGVKSRKNIDGYNLEFINASLIFTATLIIIGYISYTVSPEVRERFHSDYLYITSIFVILGVLRYMQIAFVEQNSASPTKVLIRDRFLQLSILFWLGSFVWIVNL